MIVPDIYGNNALVVCPACEKPYIVTAWQEDKRGARACPHCNSQNGVRFADAKRVYDESRAGVPKVEHTTRLLFNKQWVGQGVMCEFTAEDGVVYRYHHDDLLNALVEFGSNLKNTKSWQERGLYHFPRLSEAQKRLLEPYQIGSKTISPKTLPKLLNRVLKSLNTHKIRATYGAVADILEVHPMKVGGLLGERRPEASWVVSKTTGQPSGYGVEDCHPGLYENPRVLESGMELKDLMEGD